MPTLAQRWKQEGIQEGKQEGKQEGIQEGIEKGYILDKQDVLIMLLSTRFGLDEDEKEFIRTITGIDLLNAALKKLLTAESKEEILDHLKSDRPF